MLRAGFICTAMAAATVVATSAEDFALTFRTVPAQEVMAFPGGYGVYGQLHLTKPAALKNEPKAISSRPLYGECPERTKGSSFIFRLDESKGDGKGYDQLIVDMNQNGDLTDDPVVGRVTLPTDRQDALSTAVQRQRLFGPVEAPAGKLIAGGRPIYFAQAYINPLPPARPGQDLQNIYAGQLRLKAAWYLDTTVELNGVKQKVGVFDGDSNLRLGDLPEPFTYTNDEEKNWYFQYGDSLLVDANGSGAFESDSFQSEYCAFSSVLYLGPTAYKVALDGDCKTLRVTPWTEPLAEVALQPQGGQVRKVTLAWEQPGGKWQLIRPGVENGNIKVPPGSYRLYGCALLSQAAAPRDQVMVSAMQRVPKTPFKFAAGQANALRCGAPLDIKVTSEKRKPESWEVSAGRVPKPGPEDSEFVLTINAQAVGADGEVYSTFAKGDKFRDDPPKPTFTVVEAGGKQLASGNLEYG